MLRALFNARIGVPTLPRRASLFGPRCDEVFSDAKALARRMIFRAACDLPDGTLCDEQLLTAIAEEAYARRIATGTLAGPEIPRFSDLRVKTAGLPEWWHQAGNLALMAPGSGAENLNCDFSESVPSDVVMIIGARSKLLNVRFIGSNALLAVGDDVLFGSSSVNMGENATILIGQASSATWMCTIDARNGGIVAIGEDAMIASGVWLATDDGHAIRDADTNERLNLYGGRIVVDKHVWLGDQVRLMGDCFIGSSAVVGVGSLVKNASLPAQTVSVGRPARPIRTGVTWSRLDLP